MNRVSTSKTGAARPRCAGLFALVAGLTGAFLLAGCSTVAKRIEEEQATFDRLSVADQELVSRGKIGEGLGKREVYIAWGKPDRSITRTEKRKTYDTWIYYGYRTVTYYDYDWVPYRAGDRIYWTPITRPYYDTYPYLFQQVTFANGRVVDFQTPLTR
jgi:hypothetical protein